MLISQPNEDRLYRALVERETAFDGRAYVCVRTTGIFCRLSCPARSPKRENCLFFDSVAACLDAGFRACKRCRPLDSAARTDPLVAGLLAALEAEPGRRWQESDLVARGHDPSTVRRAFKRNFGITFLEMARLTRVRSGAATLARGSRVIDAQLEAGFDSGSGFRAAFARILGQSPARFTGDERLKADWIDTPVGPMIAVADRHALHLLEFFDRRALPRELTALQRTTGSAVGIGRQPPVEQLAGELAAYFSARTARFETPLALGGTPFSRTVWRALRQIPPGETRSYSQLAAAIGRPASVRAVARANGANQLALIVPCHRVIGADGALTGYGGGLWRKRWLIEHEMKLTNLKETSAP